MEESGVPSYILNKVLSAHAVGLSKMQMFWYCQVPSQYFAEVDAFWDELTEKKQKDPNFSADPSNED